MLFITTWLWGDKYDTRDVCRLRAGVERHLHQPHLFTCIVEPGARGRDLARALAPDIVSLPFAHSELIEYPGCFVRLEMFSEGFQLKLGAEPGDRIVCMDLDSVVTGHLDPLFDRPETFMILQGANAANPCPYNGSLMMLRAGCHREVWDDFDLDTELCWRKDDTDALDRKGCYYEFPDDQGWLAHKLPGMPGWKVGPQSGVYAFQKPGWPPGTDLPAGARLVVFPGARSPETFKNLPWIREHWRT